MLDTNCVVSALLFSRGRLAWLRHAWHSRTLIPLVDRATTTELIRVLSYPKFRLTQIEQDALLADYLPYAETITTPAKPHKLPKLRDPDDTKFLALAVSAHADALISGDEDILTVKTSFNTSPIMTATEFSAWLDSRHASGTGK